MDKFIKWELKNFFQNKKYWFLAVAVIYLLFLIIPLDSNGFIQGLVELAYSVVIILSAIGSFLFGAKTIVDTYKDKTFLLESMIPMPVKTTLLSKYFIGIIINLVFSIITIIGVSCLAIKGGGINLLMDILKKFITEFEVTAILRASILYILSTVFFLALVVLGFITVKVIKPNSGGSKILGIIGWVFILYTYGFIMTNISGISVDADYITDILCLILTGISFYTTSWLIENKLEIYN